jgi:hypothetical protein
MVHKKNGKGGYDVMLAATDDVLDSEKMFNVGAVVAGVCGLSRADWGRSPKS